MFFRPRHPWYAAALLCWLYALEVYTLEDERKVGMKKLRQELEAYRQRENQYALYQNEIRLFNINNIQTFCLACLVFSAVALAFKLIPCKTLDFSGGGTYLLMAVSLGGLLLVRLWLPRCPRAVTPGCYFILFGFLLVFICTGTVWDPDSTSVLFLVFLVAAPLFFADRPWRVVLFQLACSLLFGTMAVVCKPWAVARVDLYNTAAVFLMGGLLNILFLRIKLKYVVLTARLEKMSSIDPLTQVFNRRAGEELVMQYLASEQHPAALLAVDIDNFKSVNDCYGHSVGDQALVAVTQGIRGALGCTDVLYRLGGDEFTVFLPHLIVQESALRAAERIVAGVSAQKVEQPGLTLHISVGISFYPQDGTDFKTLYQKADQNLYRAKHEGKNRAVRS
jgi:diguanylate cyclase (GGDEF)-like protein